MTTTKSGDILSALIALAIAISTLTSPVSSQAMQLLQNAGAMPEWAILSVTCSVLCLITTLTNYDKLQAPAKFMSGCVWGSMVMFLGLEGSLYPLFWIATVLFAYDFYTVITRSKLWSRRNTLSPLQ